MRILVVEDEPTVAAALERGLAAEGYDVDLASNGDDGLWMGLEHVYAVIVIDLMLPGRNGYQVCRELRSSGVSTPILILTAKGGEYDEAEGLDAGADDYMTKPFSLVVLSARLRALLRRRPVLAHRVQVVADLEIDFDGRRCHRAGTAIDLTHREFALLETLARDPGTVRSKPFLLQEVWGPEFQGGANVVEVYIGYLRKKLDVGFHTKLIETVHGHGYRLRP